MKAIFTNARGHSLLVGFVASLSLMMTSVQAHEHDHPSEQDSHHQQAHEHGVAQMQMVIAENEVLIEVNSPLFNVVGFENAPKTELQRKAIQQQLSTLSESGLFTFSADALCQLQSYDSHLPFKMAQGLVVEGVEEAHEHEHAHEQAATHQNIHFEYQLLCQNPQNLTELNSLPLFTAWPNLQTLRVEWIHHGVQSARNLSRQHPVLSL